MSRLYTVLVDHSCCEIPQELDSWLKGLWNKPLLNVFALLTDYCLGMACNRRLKDDYQKIETQGCLDKEPFIMRIMLWEKTSQEWTEVKMRRGKLNWIGHA